MLKKCSIILWDFKQIGLWFIRCIATKYLLESWELENLFMLQVCVKGAVNLIIFYPFLFFAVSILMLLKRQDFEWSYRVTHHRFKVRINERSCIYAIYVCFQENPYGPDSTLKYGHYICLVGRGDRKNFCSKAFDWYLHL